MKWVHYLKPKVNKVWLIIFAGLMWSGVGIMLNRFASQWLGLVTIHRQIWIVIFGLILAVLIYWFGFSRVARKNIQRINGYLSEKVCLFAFQQWSSYPLVVFMIGLGIVLRVYSPIPKPWLAVLYIGIGGALFFSSFHYHVAAYHRISGCPKKSG
jgi:hypothetical protein